MATDAPEDIVEAEVRSERAPFEMVPTELWMGGARGGACSPQAVQAYLLLRQSGAEAGFKISRKRLAAKVGKSLRTIDAWMGELVDAGWLLITPQFRKSGDEQQTSNAYLVLWDRLTGEDDPRYRKHLADVARFNEDMIARKEANREDEPGTPSQKTARGDLAENCEGGVAENCEAPSQKTATQDSDSLTHTLSTQTAAAQPHANHHGDDEQGSVRSVTRATRHEPNSESPQTSRDASGARYPWRPFPNQCSGHQEAAYDGACWGCKRTRETNLTNDRRRAARIVEALEVIALMPPCAHGTPGGSVPHPEHADALMCPLCRVDAPADDEPTTMTRHDSQRLHALLNSPDTTTTTGVTPSILEATEGAPR